MYKRAAIIFIIRRSLLRNNLYNKSQLSLLAASFKFLKNRILYNIFYSENLLSALSPEFLFAFDWFILFWSCFGFVLNIFRINFTLLWMENGNVSWLEFSFNEFFQILNDMIDCWLTNIWMLLHCEIMFHNQLRCSCFSFGETGWKWCWWELLVSLIKMIFIFVQPPTPLVSCN